MDHVGPRFMYRVSSGIALMGSLVFALVLQMRYVSSPPQHTDLQLLPTEDSTAVGEHSNGEESQEDAKLSLELPELGRPA